MGVCPRVGSWILGVDLFLASRQTATLISIVDVLVYTLSAVSKRSSLPMSLPALDIILVWGFCQPVGVKRRLVVALICISPITSLVSNGYLSSTNGPFTSVGTS